MDRLLHTFHVSLVGPRRAVVIHPIGNHWPAIIDAGANPIEFISPRRAQLPKYRQ